MKAKPKVSFDHFLELDLRAGRVLDAKPFPEAKKPAYILEIDFGPLGVLKSSAQITQHYSCEDLKGEWVIAVVNFHKKQIGPIQSECLVLGVYDQNQAVRLLQVKGDISPGSPIA